MAKRPALRIADLMGSEATGAIEERKQALQELESIPEANKRIEVEREAAERLSTMSLGEGERLKLPTVIDETIPSDDVDEFIERFQGEEQNLRGWRADADRAVESLENYKGLRTVFSTSLLRGINTASAYIQSDNGQLIPEATRLIGALNLASFTVVRGALNTMLSNINTSQLDSTRLANLRNLLNLMSTQDKEDALNSRIQSVLKEAESYQVERALVEEDKDAHRETLVKLRQRGEADIQQGIEEFGLGFDAARVNFAKLLYPEQEALGPLCIRTYRPVEGDNFDMVRQYGNLVRQSIQTVEGYKANEPWRTITQANLSLPNFLRLWTVLVTSRDTEGNYFDRIVQEDVRLKAGEAARKVRVGEREQSFEWGVKSEAGSRGPLRLKNFARIGEADLKDPKVIADLEAGARLEEGGEGYYHVLLALEAILRHGSDMGPLADAIPPSEPGLRNREMVLEQRWAYLVGVVEGLANAYFSQTDEYTSAENDAAVVSSLNLAREVNEHLGVQRAVGLDSASTERIQEENLPLLVSGDEDEVRNAWLRLLAIDGVTVEPGDGGEAEDRYCVSETTQEIFGKAVRQIGQDAARLALLRSTFEEAAPRVAALRFGFEQPGFKDLLEQTSQRITKASQVREDRSKEVGVDGPLITHAEALTCLYWTSQVAEQLFGQYPQMAGEVMSTVEAGMNEEFTNLVAESEGELLDHYRGLQARVELMQREMEEYVAIEKGRKRRGLLSRVSKTLEKFAEKHGVEQPVIRELHQIVDRGNIRLKGNIEEFTAGLLLREFVWSEVQRYQEVERSVAQRYGQEANLESISYKVHPLFYLTTEEREKLTVFLARMTSLRNKWSDYIHQDSLRIAGTENTYVAQSSLPELKRAPGRSYNFIQYCRDLALPVKHYSDEVWRRPLVGQTKLDGRLVASLAFTTSSEKYDPVDMGFEQLVKQSQVAQEQNRPPLVPDFMVDHIGGMIEAELKRRGKSANEELSYSEAVQLVRESQYKYSENERVIDTTNPFWAAAIQLAVIKRRQARIYR